MEIIFQFYFTRATRTKFCEDLYHFKTPYQIFIISKDQIPTQSCEMTGVTGEASVVQGCGFFEFLVV